MRLKTSGTPQTRGTGSRFDKFTPNFIAKSVAQAPGGGHWNGALGKIFCAKCSQTRQSKGHTKRAGMCICAECMA